MIHLKHPCGTSVTVNEEATLSDVEAAVPRFFSKPWDKANNEIYRGCVISSHRDTAAAGGPVTRWSCYVFDISTLGSLVESIGTSSVDCRSDCIKLIDETLAGLGRYEVLKD